MMFGLTILMSSFIISLLRPCAFIQLVLLLLVWLDMLITLFYFADQASCSH